MFALIYDDIFIRHRSDTYHPENPGRLISIVEHLKSKNLFNKYLIQPKIAKIDDVIKVHDEKYVKKILELCDKYEFTYLDGDTYLCSYTCQAALTAVGALIKGFEMINEGTIKSFYALVRPPGHHAGRRGKALTAPTQGFCIFNNVAICAQYAIEKGLKKIAIIDIDVHHGNGTQEIFYDTSKVLYISFHQDPYTLYPGTGFIHEVGYGDGEGFNVNIPLPPGTGDDMYREIFDEIVLNILEQYKPDLILVSLGFDAHIEDPLAQLSITLNSYSYVIEKIWKFINKHNVKGLGLTLEGGYNLNVLAKGSEIIVKILTNQEYEIPDKETESRLTVESKCKEIVQDIKNVHKKYWSF